MADMGEDQITTYKAQLQQVEAALTTDPNNEDLLKLKQDLQEVIDLSLDLAKAGQSGTGPSGEGAAPQPVKEWQVGDMCMAPWSEDGGFYEATIDEKLEGGRVTVTFEGWGNSEIALDYQLKLPEESSKRSASEAGLGGDWDKPKSKKEMLKAKQEYKKKKNMKKALRLKEIEEARESEKNKWQDFNNKAFNKGHKKGKVKKSIFASPESVDGRVGVGTCGIADKPMTKYEAPPQYARFLPPQ
ncbi:survival of motor neuron-related-splicing factor 30-like [Branchiostoma floridae]|uniref:Survival of motor neuron-related-splicing factor 30 n=1 Tax=Branchiostoma floridae TaxID=7739 RepID=A0A9J7HHN4_BRAFL|nr:survival of motor neuron-related-splicing factor 30-like [Branchiostoma floridae]